MDDGIYIFRRCVTLKSGRRICRPPGKAFRFRVGKKRKPPTK